MKKEILKYDWKYVLKGENLSVIPKPEDAKKLPNSLFKFHDLGNRAIEALEHSYIYAPHPDQLNDPFDCFENLIRFDDPQAIYNFTYPDYTLDEIKKRIEENDQKFLKTLQYNFKLIIYSKVGIVSLTDNPDNILMWSYYNNHKGFCLEFDYSKFPFKFQGPFQVNYQDEFETISLKELHLAFLYQTNLKKGHWKHESEWRLLVEKHLNKQMKMPGIDSLKHHYGTDRKFEYPKESLQSITLGHSFFHNNNEYKVEGNELHIYLNENVNAKNFIISFALTEDIPIYIMTRNDSNFTLDRKRIRMEKLDNHHFRIL